MIKLINKEDPHNIDGVKEMLLSRIILEEGEELIVISRPEVNRHHIAWPYIIEFYDEKTGRSVASGAGGLESVEGVKKMYKKFKRD